MAPRDHRIHLGRMDSPESSPQNHSSAKICFFGTPKSLKNRPRAKLSTSGFQNPTPASKIRPRACKKQKMRAKKPCRTPPSKKQTEPYSACYGRKPFWGVPLRIRVCVRGDLGATFQNPDICKGNLGNLEAIWALSEWYLRFWELVGALGSQGWPSGDLRRKC